MKTLKINDNISLHYIDMKKLKTNTVGIYIRRPLKEEEASKNAVLSYVLKNGCKKFDTTLKITRQLQNLYGATLNAGVIKNGDNHVICFDAETISDKYAPEGEKLTNELLDLLLNVIFKPLTNENSFNKDIVEREKKTLINRIDSLVNDKRAYAQLRCNEEMCKGDNYALTRLGTKDSALGIDEKNLYEHYEKIISSSQIDIFISGEANINEASNIVNDFVKNINFIKAEIPESKIIEKSENTNNVTDKLDVTQGKLSIGFTTQISANDKDYPALVVANSIFGSGTHSKLFNNVREKLSLAYYASSSLHKFKGLMFVDAGIEFDKFQEAYKETIYQLNLLKKGEVSDEELKFSKSTIINSLNSYYDDQRYMQMYALDCLYLGINCDIEKYKTDIENVTIEDILRVSKNINENTVYFLTGKND